MNGRQASAQGLGNPGQLLSVNGAMVQPTPPGGPPQPTQMAYGGAYVTQPLPPGLTPGLMARVVPGAPGTQPLYYSAGPTGVARPMVAGPGQMQHMQGVPQPMNTGPQQRGGPPVAYPPHPQAMGRGMSAPMPGMQRHPQSAPYPMGIPMASMPPGMRGAFRGPQGMQPGASVMNMAGPSGLPPGAHPMQGQHVMLPPGYGPPPPGTQVGMTPQGQPVMIQQSPRKQPGPLAGPMTSSSPRNASPHAGNASAGATPASAGTPGSRMARAPTPTGRPGTATNPPPPQSQTPRMQHVDMQNSVQQSPQSLHRVASMPNMNMAPQPGAVNPTMFRTTPAQLVAEQQINAQSTMGPGGQGPMDGIRYTSMHPHPHPGASGPPVSMQPQMQPGPRMGMVGGPLALGQPPQIQPQMTGDPQPLMAQHTGGSLGGPPPLTPQHTGGASYPPGSAMSGGAPGGGPPAPAPVPAPGPAASRSSPVSAPARPNTSRTSTPRMRPASTTPHGPNEAMDGVEHHPPATTMQMLPPEVSTIAEMNFQGMHGGPPNFRMQSGTMRLLHFSNAMNENRDPQSIPGRSDESYWSKLLANHFTEDASLFIRIQDPKKRTTNSFVRLPYGLLTRFFTTLSQSEIYRMSLNLDGPSETPDNHVICQTARWPMHYSNGYIIELVGQLQARCKIVPMLPQRPPDDPSSESDPARGPIPYMVKIEEMVFDSEYSTKYIDVGLLRQQAYEASMATDAPFECKIPEEPANSYGLPSMAMRMVEFAEGMHALWPIIKYEGNAYIPPSHVMRELAQTVDYPSYMPYPVPLPEGNEVYVSASDPTIDFGRVMKKEDPYTDAASASTSNAMSNSAHSTPSQKPGVAGAGAGSNSAAAAAASVSPTISSKPPSKKGGAGGAGAGGSGAPGSPTKASAAEKEKASTKRKNTIDANADGPPNKRSRMAGRKLSKGM